MDVIDKGIATVAKADALRELDRQERLRTATYRAALSEFFLSDQGRALISATNPNSETDIREVTHAAISYAREALSLNVALDSGVAPELPARPDEQV